MMWFLLHTFPAFKNTCACVMTTPGGLDCIPFLYNRFEATVLFSCYNRILACTYRTAKFFCLSSLSQLVTQREHISASSSISQNASIAHWESIGRHDSCSHLSNCSPIFKHLWSRITYQNHTLKRSDLKRAGSQIVKQSAPLQRLA